MSDFFPPTGGMTPATCGTCPCGQPAIYQVSKLTGPGITEEVGPLCKECFSQHLGQMVREAEQMEPVNVEDVFREATPAEINAVMGLPGVIILMGDYEDKQHDGIVIYHHNEPGPGPSILVAKRVGYKPVGHAILYPDRDMRSLFAIELTRMVGKQMGVGTEFHLG